MSLATKVFRSSTLNLIEHFVQLAVVFVVTPLMIHHLGEVEYGSWLISMAIIGYYKLLDFGITTAGTRFLARSIGAGNREDYQINVSTLLTIYRRIGLLTIPLSITVAVIAPNFIRDEGFANSIRWVLFAFGFNVSIRFFTRIFSVILRSHVRYDLIVASSLTKTITQGCLLIYFLQHGADLITLILIHLSADLIDQIILFVFSRKIDPKIKLTTENYQADRAREIFCYGWTVFLGTVGTTLRVGLDPIVIGSLNGLSFVPIYSVGRRFISIFADIINSVFGGHLLAALSQTEARDGPEGIRNNFLKIIRLSSAFAALGGCALAIYSPYLIDRWIGKAFIGSSTVIKIMIIPSTINLAQYPVWDMFYTTNRHRYIIYVGIIGGLFNLILSIPLALTIGFMGVVWATAIDVFIVAALVVPILVTRSLDITISQYLKTILPGFMVAALSSFVWWVLINQYLKPDYFRLCILAFGHAAISFGILWYTVLDKTQRRQILSMFRPIEKTASPES